MKFNINAIQKGLLMAMAAIVISIPLANSSEAAAPKHMPPPPPRHEKQVSDVHFFKGHVPKYHKVCHNPYHQRWAPHFHCNKSYHHHDDHKWNHHNPPPQHHRR